MLAKIKTYASDFLHLFYPHICIGCGSDVLADTQVICAKCFNGLPVTNYFNHANNMVERIFAGRILVQNAGSLYHFSKQSILQNIIFEMKYRDNKDAGIFLGKQTGKAIAASGLYNDVDVIVPLPLNKRKQKQRGYNQALLIAQGIADVMQKPIADNIAVRKIYTETQTHKDRISRWHNMQHAFSVHNAAELEGKHVLLVDDIVTTGATLEACGQTILAIAGTKLSIATVAHTI